MFDCCASIIEPRNDVFSGTTDQYTHTHTYIYKYIYKLIFVVIFASCIYFRIDLKAHYRLRCSHIIKKQLLERQRKADKFVEYTFKSLLGSLLAGEGVRIGYKRSIHPRFSNQETSAKPCQS